MNKDLYIIKKKYGEKMMHLCRELFPTLLETEGLLSKLLLDNFEPTRFLYYDIVNSKSVDNFKDFIYCLVNNAPVEIVETDKSPKELMDMVGYYLYECKTEEEIQSFKKYYNKREELCTFSDKNGRLSKNYVFFAVKKNVDEIKRKDFKIPQKHDLYGTSVISIQFKRGINNTLSIKNRYNHSVNNPDSTFLNNLENIIPGLTKSFEKEYGLNIVQNQFRGFELLNYIEADDRKYHKYNYEINEVYYCPNNIIIDNLEVKRYDSQRYLIIDYFIIDFSNKTIELYDKNIKDSFIDSIKNIEKISVTKISDTENKRIEIITKEHDVIIIEVDKLNRIIGYTNSKCKYIGDNFLEHNRVLNYISLLNVEEIGDNFLSNNENLESVYLPIARKIGNGFIQYNTKIKKSLFPQIIEIGDDCLSNSKALEILYIPNLKYIGDYFLASNNKIKNIDIQKLIRVGKGFFKYSKSIESYNLPNLDEQSKINLKDFFEIVNNKESIQRKIEKLKQEKNKILNEYMTGLINKEEFEEKLKEINNHQK